jgi:hypothetical protein
VCVCVRACARSRPSLRVLTRPTCVIAHSSNLRVNYHWSTDYFHIWQELSIDPHTLHYFMRTLVHISTDSLIWWEHYNYELSQLHGLPIVHTARRIFSKLSLNILQITRSCMGYLISVCMDKRKCVRARVCVCARLCVRVRVYIDLYTVCACMRACVRACVRVYLCACVCACVCARVW